MDLLTTFTDYLVRELDIFLGFSWRDWSSTLVPGILFSVGAMRSVKLPLPSILSKYLLLLSWLTHYVYFFDLSNQIMGIDEDRINKPDRPIPSGLVTPEGAKSRWIASLLLFLAIGVYEPIILPGTIIWVFTTAFLCLTPTGDHWFGKNCVGMATGCWILLNTSWITIAPATPKSERYALAVSLWAGINTQVQDLRDAKGDAAVGRKTLPIVFGDSASRWIITFLLMPTSVWVLWMGDIVPIAPFPLVASHIYLGYRIMQSRGSRYDHKTYMHYTYVFCFILALTALGPDTTTIPRRLPEQMMISLPSK